MPDMTLWNVLKSKLFLLFFELALSLIMLNNNNNNNNNE